MYCTNCGKEIQEDYVVCPNCGTFVGLQQNSHRMHSNDFVIKSEKFIEQNIKSKSIKTKRNIAVIIAVLFIIIILNSCIGGGDNSRLSKLINNNDVNGIIELYTKQYKGSNSKIEFCNDLLKCEESLYEDYNKGKITFDYGREKYKTIDEVADYLDLDDRISAGFDKFEDLKRSKDNFEKGNEILNKLRKGAYGNDKQSINNAATSCVDKFRYMREDDTNYSKAEKLKEEASSYYKFNGVDVK